MSRLRSRRFNIYREIARRSNENLEENSLELIKQVFCNVPCGQSCCVKGMQCVDADAGTCMAPGQRVPAGLDNPNEDLQEYIDSGMLYNQVWSNLGQRVVNRIEAMEKNGTLSTGTSTTTTKNETIPSAPEFSRAGAIAGIVACGIIAITAIALLTICCVQRRRARKQRQQFQSPSPPPLMEVRYSPENRGLVYNGAVDPTLVSNENLPATTNPAGSFSSTASTIPPQPPPKDTLKPSDLPALMNGEWVLPPQHPDFDYSRSDSVTSSHSSQPGVNASQKMIDEFVGSFPIPPPPPPKSPGTQSRRPSEASEMIRPIVRRKPVAASISSSRGIPPIPPLKIKTENSNFTRPLPDLTGRGSFVPSPMEEWEREKLRTEARNSRVSPVEIGLSRKQSVRGLNK